MLSFRNEGTVSGPSRQPMAHIALLPGETSVQRGSQVSLTLLFRGLARSGHANHADERQQPTKVAQNGPETRLAKRQENHAFRQVDRQPEEMERGHPILRTECILPRSFSTVLASPWTYVRLSYAGTSTIAHPHHASRITSWTGAAQVRRAGVASCIERTAGQGRCTCTPSNQADLPGAQAGAQAKMKDLEAQSRHGMAGLLNPQFRAQLRERCRSANVTKGAVLTSRHQ